MSDKIKLNDGREYKVYPLSVHDDVTMVYDEEKDYLLSSNFDFEGEKVECDGKAFVLAPLSHKNADLLRSIYPFTAPSRVLTRDKTMGVGDRLGVAGDGHIAVFKKYPNVTPILAQQSIRELTLTDRTFGDVLDAATFTVFRNNYTTGWGADGDHVKTAAEVDYALSSGFTMITLDCSEQIDNSIDSLSVEEVNKKYVPNKELEELYLNKTFTVEEGVTVSFDEDLFKRTVLIYSEALKHAEEIYYTHILDKNGERRADFEISIDETMTPTKPEQHYFVASELKRHGVVYATIAPRFCGEFQKGIDYIGDLDQFAREMKVHAAIARHFGYKLSIHSGSDKFSAFPSIGKETRGKFHVKTAGTNWLEAMKLVAIKDPALYREIHEYALTYAFEKASAYYHVTTNLNNIPSLDTLSDAELPDLFKNNDSRQLIHITYGLILTEKSADGSYRFKDKLYTLWRKYRKDYKELILSHIGHHVQAILGE